MLCTERGAGRVFGSDCPIRRNLELIQQPLIRERLGNLLALCDYNGLHMPIRQILLLLVNAVLGHADVKDGLMTAADVPVVIQAGTVAKASLYDNVFGGNLTETRRVRTPVSDALDRIGVGHETSNRIDNILIFGDTDDALRSYFDWYMTTDRFYGANSAYVAAQRHTLREPTRPASALPGSCGCSSPSDEDCSSRFLIIRPMRCSYGI